MISSELVNILVEDRGDFYTIAKLQWRKEGRGESIFLHLPYFADTEGTLRRFVIRGPAGTQSTIDFAAEGTTTTHGLKYSDHPSGEALFTKTGKALTTIRNWTRPLAEYSGILFYLNFWGLNGFSVARKQKHFPRDDQHESSVVVGATVNTGRGARRVSGVITGHLRHSPVVDKAHHLTPEQRLRPIMWEHAGMKRNGNIALAPSDHQSDMAMLFSWVQHRERYTGRKPRMALTGGFYDDLPATDPNATLSGISILYGHTDFDSLRAQLGSSDFATGSSGGFNADPSVVISPD